MSSIGFTGITSARYFSTTTFPLPPLVNGIIKTGFDVINKYTVTQGAGCSTSTFYSPYAKQALQSTTSTYNLCEGYQYLHLIMGIITVTINFEVETAAGGVYQRAGFRILFQYTYEGKTIEVESLVPELEYLSTPVLLPLPSICTTNSSKDCSSYPCLPEFGLVTTHIPIVLYFNKNPLTIFREVNASTTTGKLPLSAYVISDAQFIKRYIDLSLYSPVVSDVTSSLKAPFKINRSLLASIGEKIVDVRIIGGFTINIQYLKQNLSQGTVVIGTSANSPTLGSVILETVQPQA